MNGLKSNYILYRDVKNERKLPDVFEIALFTQRNLKKITVVFHSPWGFITIIFLIELPFFNNK